jgi:hypothetical protein
MLSRIKFEIEDLANEMLDQLPSEVWASSTTTFFDPAIGGGQFVREIERRLREAGHSDANIKERVYGCEASGLNVKFALNKHKLVGNYAVCDFLAQDFKGMKFDVIVGNPPYQDADDSGGALWSKFANKVFDDLAKDNGHVAFIHPPSFVGKHLSSGKGKSDYTVFANNQIEKLHILDDFNRSKHFTGVGTRICWYIARKSKPSNPTKIIGYNGNELYEFEDQFTNVTFLPNSIDEVSMSIHNKLVSVSSLKFTQKRELHYFSMKKRNEVSETKSKDFKYKSYFSHKITRFSNFKFSDYEKIKVMVPQTSTVDNSFIDKDCNVSEDLYYVTCSSTEEAKAIQEYLKSNLVKYIGKNYRPGRNLGSLLSAGIIPNPAQRIQWTQEEIDYIEANVK